MGMNSGCLPAVDLHGITDDYGHILVFTASFAFPSVSATSSCDGEVVHQGGVYIVLDIGFVYKPGAAHLDRAYQVASIDIGGQDIRCRILPI